MAEEFRFFLRAGLYVAAAGVIYWLVSYEPAGTVLLVALVLAVATFVLVGRAFSRVPHRRQSRTGPLRWANLVLGIVDDPSEPPPLQGGPEAVPLASAWPIVTAGGTILVGLGLVFGAWLLATGLLLLVGGLLGWLAQADASA